MDGWSDWRSHMFWPRRRDRMHFINEIEEYAVNYVRTFSQVFFCFSFLSIYRKNKLHGMIPTITSYKYSEYQPFNLPLSVHAWVAYFLFSILWGAIKGITILNCVHLLTYLLTSLITYTSCIPFNRLLCKVI